MRILRHLKVIFKVTKAKKFGKANDLNLNEIYLVFLSTSRKIKYTIACCIEDTDDEVYANKLAGTKI